jgi:Cdc6-like AAA superfamily ATPase
VLSSIEALKASKKNLNPFKFILINCLKLKSPTDAYSILWKSISGKHLSPATASKKLTAHFDALRGTTVAPVGGQVTVCLIDEMDYLLTSNQAVIYNMLDWPNVSNSDLVVLGLANTMDLPERFNTRAMSRMNVGTFSDRMVFKPYSVEQIEQILIARMGALNVFAQKELKLLTRKAATVAGDLRAALRICQRAIEMHRNALSPTDIASSMIIPVPIIVVSKAAAEYKLTPLMAMTKNACQLYKALFVSIIRHNRATGGSLFISIDELFQRLQDTIADLKQSPDFFLRLPPYCIYLESIDKMVGEGFLILEKDHESRSVGTKVKLALFYTMKMVKTKLDAAEIQNSLKGECFEKLL